MTKEQIKEKAKDFVSKIAGGTAKEMDYYANILVEFATEVTKELEKENAELKNKLEHRNCLDCSNHSSNLRMRTLELEKECTKAKEIIKKFSEFVNSEIEYDPEHPQEHTDLWNKLCEEAEQFLNIEVEK